MGKVQGAKVESIEGAGSHASVLGGFHARLARKDAFPKDNDFVFPSVRLKGKKPLSASIMVQKYLRPAAVKAGVIKRRREGSFRFSQLPAFTGNGDGEAESGPENGARYPASRGLRDDHAAVRSVRHGVDAGCAQGKFLEQLMGDRIHLLTERVQ